MSNLYGLRGTLSGGNRLSGKLNTPSALSANLGVKPAQPITDYERLTNKPQINGVTLSGDQTMADLRAIYSDTTANWNADRDFIPPAGAIIIYSDYSQIDDTPVPAMKIGDGLAYLIDLPFVSDDIRYAIAAHVGNTSIHITSEERQYWNDKVACSVTVQPDGTYCLIFSND